MMDVIAGPGLPVLSAFADPGVCMVCEQECSGLQHATRIVDTQRVLREKKVGRQVQSKLRGRKLICEGCVHHLASALGYVTAEAHAVAQVDLTDAEIEIEHLRQRESLADVLQAALEAQFPGAKSVAVAAPPVEPTEAQVAESIEAQVEQIKTATGASEVRVVS